MSTVKPRSLPPSHNFYEARPSVLPAIPSLDIQRKLLDHMSFARGKKGKGKKC